MRLTRRGTLLLVFAVAAVAIAIVVRPDGEQRPSVSIAPESAPSLGRGAALYAANCASCHGAKGEGEPNWKVQHADGTYPAPPHDASGHTWHHSDRLLLEIIRDGGGRFESATFKSRMPAWGVRLTDDEMRAVLAYLKTLWGPEERRFQAEANARDPLPDGAR